MKENLNWLVNLYSIVHTHEKINCKYDRVSSKISMPETRKKKLSEHCIPQKVNVQVETKVSLPDDFHGFL